MPVLAGSIPAEYFHFAFSFYAVILLVLVVFLEALVLWRFKWGTFRRSLLDSSMVNVASTTIVAIARFSLARWLSSPMIFFPLAWGVSTAIEGLGLRLLRRSKPIRQIWQATLVTNAVCYVSSSAIFLIFIALAPRIPYNIWIIGIVWSIFLAQSLAVYSLAILIKALVLWQLKWGKFSRSLLDASVASIATAGFLSLTTAILFRLTSLSMTEVLRSFLLAFWRFPAEPGLVGAFLLPITYPALYDFAHYGGEIIARARYGALGILVEGLILCKFGRKPILQACLSALAATTIVDLVRVVIFRFIG